MTSGASGRPEILTRRGRLLLPVFLLVLIVLAVRQLWCLAPGRVVLSGPSMGTTWSVTLAARGRARGELVEARAAIEERLGRVNGLMSTWDPDSELSRFNRHASSEPFPISAETLEVLGVAREVSEKTGGAFDVTVRPLVAAWGFGAGARAPGQGPDASELERLRQRVGFRRLELDPVAGTARKLQADLECDLSAIAKGYAVDAVARALEELGWADFLVEVGGELRARGRRPEGGAWRVGIERPAEDRRGAQLVVTLADLSMATSGDYRSEYEEGGERVTHLIDARSGRPVANRLASVTVVHRQAVVADAWATALSVLGPEAGFARAEAEGLGALFLLRDAAGSFSVRSTPAFPPFYEPVAGAPRDGVPPEP